MVIYTPYSAMVNSYGIFQERTSSKSEPVMKNSSGQRGVQKGTRKWKGSTTKRSLSSHIHTSHSFILKKNEIGSKKHASALFALFLEVAARSGDFFIPPTH